MIKNILAAIGLFTVISPLVSKHCREEMARSYRRQRNHQKFMSELEGLRLFADR